MEFFILYGVIINFANPLYATAYGLNRLDCWIAFGIAMVLYLVLYAFKAIALLKMAKTCGKEKLIWCAFVPIASTYLMGEVSGGLQMGNVKIKHIGLYAMIAEIVVCVFSLMQYIPQSYVFNNESLYTIEVDAEQNAWVFVYTNLTPAWMARLITVSSVLSSVFSFVALIAFVFLHIAFFLLPQLCAAVVYLADHSLCGLPGRRNPRLCLPQSYGRQLRGVYGGAYAVFAEDAAGAVRAIPQQRSLQHEPV